MIHSTLSRIGLALVLFLAPLTPIAVMAASGPVKITADTFTVQEGQKQATFSGNVVVVQTGLKVTADQLVVHYGAGGSQDITALDATGHVRIVTKEQTVTGDKGIYDPKTRIMKVTGNVVAKSATGTVTGPELLVNFATNTTQFSTTKGGRVTGVFNP